MSGSNNEVKSHWSERRCDFDVILFAFLYKPDNDARGSGEFAADNFNYCVSSKTTDYLKTMFGMLYEVLQKQFDASNVFAQVMRTLRAQLTSIYKPFSAMMDRFWNKFKQIGTLASRVFQHLYMAMKKAGASAIASLYIAISLQTALMNSIDLVINVIMIVLYILLALAVIFFLPILPLLAVVLMTVGGIEAAMPGKTGAMGAIFCFHKNTSVVMANGSEQHICSLKLGDTLLNGNIVEGVVEVPGQALYDIDGVLVSGYHRVYDEEKTEWVYVMNYPGAKKSDKWESTLWTLITSGREIIVKPTRTTGTIRFQDWEEIPDTEQASMMWEIVARNMLNTNISMAEVKVPQYPPCLDKTICVREYQGGWRQLEDIKIGSWIYGRKGWTRVLGIAKRQVGGGHGSEGTRITDGVWLLQKNDTWDHPDITCDTESWWGIHLITDSGVFRIRFVTGEERIVRDFTEVGENKISESDTRVDALLK